MSQEASGPPPRPTAPVGAASGSRVLGFTPIATGARIGELVVQSVLGAGEFGITYAAEHEKRSKRYALKEYFPKALAIRDAAGVRPRPDTAEAFAWGLERFLSEGRLLQDIRHPALVSVLGVTRHAGTGYIGMAYEHGSDFNVWLHERKRVAGSEDLDKLIEPLLDGLAQAHARKLFHFDITPEVIIVRESGGPVLADFGAHRVGLRRRMPPGELSRLTYAAPELLTSSGGPIGPWTDIYSLAGLLYLAVTGKPPLSAIERARGASMESAATAAKGRYRAEFLKAIDAGLEPHPARRPRTVVEWRARLLQSAGSGLSLSRLLALGRRAVTPPKPAQSPPTEEAVSLGGAPVVATPARAAEVAPSSSMNAMSALMAGFTGAICGAMAGAAIGYLASWLLRRDCIGDACTLTSLALPFSLIGTAIGAYEALRFMRRRSRQNEAEL